MPELPELGVVREVLARRLTGRRIERVMVAPKGGPILIRDLTGQGFAALLAGSLIQSVTRRGKFLLFTLRPLPNAGRQPQAYRALSTLPAGG